MAQRSMPEADGDVDGFIAAALRVPPLRGTPPPLGS